MSYSTRAEVRSMLKDDTLNTIFGDAFHEDAAEREELAGPVIDEAIADADGEIDGYLAKRYQVPLSPVPKVINKYSKDIAIYNLFSRLGISEDSEQKIYLTRHDAAIKFLTLVADGKVSIGAEAEDPARAAAAGFVRDGVKPRAVSRRSVTRRSAEPQRTARMERREDKSPAAGRRRITTQKEDAPHGIKRAGERH